MIRSKLQSGNVATSRSERGESCDRGEGQGRSVRRCPSGRLQGHRHCPEDPPNVPSIADHHRTDSRKQYAIRTVQH